MSTGHLSCAEEPALAPASTRTLSVHQQNQVREQLDRILASSLFRHSKRYTPFLRFTVNSVLEHGANHLKERTIGVEAFKREPSYDTNLDPVVRVTAAQVRKRLKQYYEEVGHERELRIELAPGSYIPDIKFQPDITPERNTLSSQPPTHRGKNAKRRLLIACPTAVCAIAICTALIATPRQSALDQFLKPIISAKTPVLICIPGPSFGPPPPTPVVHSNTSGSPSAEAVNAANPDRASFSDSMVLTALANTLGRSGISLRVRRTQEAGLDDLKEGPVILVGGFSNRWTMRLENGLRFSLMRDGALRYIGDRRNPSSRDWAIQANSAEASVDYALISRVFDPNTGRVLLTVAGVHHFGTEGAAECFIDSRCFERAEKMAPGDWQRANIQVVLRTAIIGNRPSRPEVLAATVW